MTSLTYLQVLPPITIFTSGKANSGTCNQCDIPAAAPAFVIEKVKTAKNVLDEKTTAVGTPAAGIPTPAL